MSEMVDRVAKALRTYGVRIWGAPHLYAVIGPDFDKPIVEGMNSSEAYDKAAEMNARAAIEAMRSLTDDMLVAALNAGATEGRALADRLQEKDRIPVIVVVGHGSIYAKAYEAAIDEALK